MVSQRKIAYGQNLVRNLEEYSKCLVITVDNVSSKAMANMRKRLRGRAVILMGKNTMVRKVIRDYCAESNNDKLLNIIPLVEGNCGFVFTKESIVEIKDEIEEEKAQSPAKAGSIAPCDVVVPAGPTSMEPTMTAFFQALNIPTRIERGQISITDPQQIITKGTKVGESEASLLAKLDIKPFYYGVGVQSVYDDGQTYDVEVLNYTEDDIAGAFCQGMGKIAALSMAIDYPTVVAVPQQILNAYKNVLAVAIGAGGDYSWEHLNYIKEVLADPSKFASGGGGGGAAAGGDAGGDAGGAAAAAEPSEKSSSAAGGGGLFGSGSGSGSSDSDSSS